jgi:hypothetical protein
MSKITLELDEEDAAVILYKDGRRELVLPQSAYTSPTTSRETMDALISMVVLGDAPLYAAATVIVNSTVKEYTKLLDSSKTDVEPEDPNGNPLN